MKSIKTICICCFILFHFSLFAQENDTTIYTKPDTIARFNGDLIDFLNLSLIYPDIAKSVRIEGTPTVSFVVEKDGSVSNIQVSSKKGWGLDEEALRLASAMPKWIPAKHHGKEVRSIVDLQIQFKLSSNLEGYIVDDQIYMSCEDMPEMDGETIVEYLSRALVYPKEEKKAGIEGRVVVQFTVDENGSIYDSEIIKSATPNFDKAVLKAINKMPSWKPATNNGRPIKYRYTLPVKFSL